jgi:hypothetical protein
MGSQTTPTGMIQPTTDTTISATTTRYAAELSASQSRKQQLSLFQLRKPVTLYQRLPST